jgi:hypothetical protein
VGVAGAAAAGVGVGVADTTGVAVELGVRGAELPDDPAVGAVSAPGGDPAQPDTVTASAMVTTRVLMDRELPHIPMITT